MATARVGVSDPPVETFRELVREWKEQSEFLSNTAQMALLIAKALRHG